MSFQTEMDDKVFLRQLGIRDAHVGAANQRLSAQDLAALKGAITHKPAVRPIRHIIGGWVNDLVSTLTSLMTPAPTGNCQFYGHEIDHKTWVDLYPTCRNCGKQINSSADLRTALPKFS